MPVSGAQSNIFSEAWQQGPPAWYGNCIAYSSLQGNIVSTPDISQMQFEEIFQDLFCDIRI
jgi:hypothetical protein